MAELALTHDGERALREAENLCWRTNVAILAPEHLLAGALVVLRSAGAANLPDGAALESAVQTTCGAGSEPLRDNVMWGSAARDALNTLARHLREAGETGVDARAIALGVLASGELNPMFCAAIGTRQNDLERRLAVVPDGAG